MLSAPFRLFVFITVLFIGGLAQAQVPQLINYQGRVVVGTTNFNGSGQFKFALVNTTGSATYWSNDGTSTAGSQPSAGVTLTVTQGLYSLLLGDTTLTNMTTIPSSVFGNSDVRLRIWFNDGTNGWQLLTPDQRIAAVGYAMMAGNVANGAITSAQIANGAVGNSQLASNLTLNGTLNVGGAITAPSFSGSGSSLTGLSYSMLGGTPNFSTGLTYSGGNVTVNYGTSSTTAAAGNDSRIVNALQPTSTISSLSLASTGDASFINNPFGGFTLGSDPSAVSGYSKITSPNNIYIGTYFTSDTPGLSAVLTLQNRASNGDSAFIFHDYTSAFTGTAADQSAERGSMGWHNASGNVLYSGNIFFEATDFHGIQTSWGGTGNGTAPDVGFRFIQNGTTSTGGLAQYLRMDVLPSAGGVGSLPGDWVVYKPTFWSGSVSSVPDSIRSYAATGDIAINGTPGGDVTGYTFQNHGNAINYGDLVVDTAGNGVQIKTGSNARMGTGTLVNGTLTISNSSIQAGDEIFCQRTTLNSSSTIGLLAVTSQTAGSGFTVTSETTAGITDSTDGSSFNWFIVGSAP